MSTTEYSDKIETSRFQQWWFRRGRVYFSYFLLTAFACTTMLPFIWMINASMKPLDAVDEISPFPTLAQRARHVEMVQLSETEINGAPLSELSTDAKFEHYLGILGAEQALIVFRESRGILAETSAEPLPEVNGVDDLKTLPQPAFEELVRALAATQFSLMSYYGHNTAANYKEVWDSDDISFKRYYFNSFFIAGWVTLLQCFTSSLAAYAFARILWPGRDTVFKLYLATMMIPGVVVMIPNYVLMVNLHLLDSYVGLIVPAAFSAFGTFLLRQFMLTISPSLDEAARIDGASHWQIYWNIMLPLARPGLIVLSIFTFLGNYGSFFWPLVLIKSEHLRTLPIGMLYFDTAYGNQTNLIMAGSVLNIVPLIILFVLLQKYLVAGIQLGAVKG